MRKMAAPFALAQTMLVIIPAVVSFAPLSHAYLQSIKVLSVPSSHYCYLRPEVRLGAAAASSGRDDQDDDLERRMEMVRSLQRAYYQSSNESSSKTVLETGTGILRNLPLWRVQWTELPGRSNVLNVHEPTYTNMFESIIRGPKPWYVGHLYLPGGSKNLKSRQRSFQLKTWQEEVRDDSRFVDRDRSAVVGTLLRVSDFRRLSDGRLLLLVQALERFVIVNSVQEVPYSVANVQILPDLNDAPQPPKEADARPQRAQAVIESFRYHDYEYDAEFALPCPGSEYLNVLDILGPDVAKVLPFVPYSQSLDPSQLPEIVTETAVEDSSVRMDELSLESRLLEGHILRPPPSLLGVAKKKATIDELEDQIWVALRDFCRAAKMVLPPEVLCLLPPGRDWTIPVERLSPAYPPERRQRRLSFSISLFLEGTNIGRDLRQAWLEAPSTRERLSAILERFEAINNLLLGEFQ